MIEKYSFGLITIKGKEYNFDVEVRWTGEVLRWWRKEGHKINYEDIKRAIEEKAEVIILGTGFFGICKIDKECEGAILDSGTKLIAEKTSKATKKFNELLKSKKIIGFFHLTC